MWSKIIVDMNDQTIKKEILENEFQDLGGRALISQYLIKNVPPKCDPLGSENHLIFCTSIFAGSSLTTSNRMSVGGKSPLTGGIKESNVGGYAGALLAEHGIKLIIVKGIPENAGLWQLHLDSMGNIKLEDASMYEGLNNYEFVEKIQNTFGDRLATVSIGTAGERLYKSASIQVSEFNSNHPSRAAARGGLGALMGSKRLKSIIIEKPINKFNFEYVEKEKFNELCKKLNRMVAEGAKNDPFHNIGTIATIEVTGANGVLPVDNFSYQ